MDAETTDQRVVSFHVMNWRAADMRHEFPNLLLDRRRLAGVAGLRFIRLLGTGSTLAPSIDWRRTAAFAVWENAGAFDQFEAEHPIAARWQGSQRSLTLRMTYVGGHGRWGGVDPFTGASRRNDASDGPIAVLTRATVRPTVWPRFLLMARRTAPEPAAAGSLTAWSFGERPIGRLGTMSLWRTAGDIDHYLATSSAHREARSMARRQRWFSEELFARFSVESVTARSA